MSSVQTRPYEGHVTLDPDTAASGEPSDAKALIRSLVGSGVIQEKAPRSVEYWSGNSMPDTGLAYNISGRATVIEANVGESLVGFEDPIKAVFSTQVCTDKSVLVKRKWVVGGKAVLTPERSAARSVSVKEDVVKVELSRYGGDVSMNTNLFLDAPLAKEELDMKVNAQKRELERKLIELGYAELMSRALKLPTAFVRSTVRGGSIMNTTQRDNIQRRRAKAVYQNACFGAFGKFEFPLSNLLAAAKTATAYTGTSGPGDIMIVPHGTPEMLKYTKQSSVEYKISGLKTTDKAPITMKMDNVFDDPSSGVKIAIHRPLASYSHGSAFPEAGRNCLEETVSLWMYYPVPPQNELLCATNFIDGGFLCQRSHADAGAGSSQVTTGNAFDADVINIDPGRILNQSTSANGDDFAGVTSFGQLFAVILDQYVGTNEDTLTNVTAFRNRMNAKLEMMSQNYDVPGTLANISFKKVCDAVLKNLNLSVVRKGDGYAPIELLRVALTASTPPAVLKAMLRYEYVNFNSADKSLSVAKGKKQTVTIEFQAGDKGVLKLQEKIEELEAGDDFDGIRQLISKQGGANFVYPTLPSPALDAAKTNAGPQYFDPYSHSDETSSHYVRRVRFSMLNAVIAKAGSETGSLLVGYPMTSVSTNARTESMTVALRVYLGSILKRPENALVLPHVAFGGVIDDTGLMLARVARKKTKVPKAASQTAQDLTPVDEVDVSRQDLFDGRNASSIAKLRYRLATRGNHKDEDDTSAKQLKSQEFEFVEGAAALGTAEFSKGDAKERRFFQIEHNDGQSDDAQASIAELNDELYETEDLTLSRGGFSVDQGEWVPNNGCLQHLDHPHYFDVFNGLQTYRPPLRQYQKVSSHGAVGASA